MPRERRTPLTSQQRSFLLLELRSPDEGDGWRKVSAMVRPVVERSLIPELCEWQPHDDGTGRVRLTHDGQTVVRFLV